MTSHRLRRFAVLLLAPLALFAQTAPTPPVKPAAPAATPAPAATTDETVKLAAVEVTGSRIRLNAGEAPAVPVFTLDRIQLEELGVNRLADIRQAIPQLAPAVGFNDNLANGGPSRGQQVSTSFNLRGLGGNSTLMLIDGHRVPHSGQEAPGGAGGREDFNVDGIPVSAIERVEVLTQGASAVYGSEAIGGVVNIILKKNYTGAELSINYDNSFDQDVGDTSISLTAGFARGKLKTFLTASWEHQNALMSRDRWFSATSDPTVFGAAAQTAFYLQQPPAGAGLIASTNSPQNAGQANLPGVNSNFVIIPAGSRGNSALADYTTGAYPTRYDPANYSMLIDPARRRSVVFKGDYDYAPWLQPYVEVRWSRFENFFTGTPLTVGSQSLPAGYAGNPFGQAVFLRKVFYDQPLPQMNSYQENSGLVLGVHGDLPSGVLRNWRYDLSASFARNTISDDQIAAAAFNSTLLTAAINNTDPTKRPLLAYDSTRGDPNPAGLLASLMPVFDYRDITDVDQYAFQADGSVWSGWAGDIKAALGGEAATEKVHFHRDPGDPSLSFALTKPFSRRTTAAFAEVSVPLLSARQHIPGVYRLEAIGAVRTENFSDIGGHNTPQYSGLLQPVKWLTLRASRAEGFKTPKLYDLLAPVSTGTATLTTASNVHDTLRGGELVLGTVTSTSGGQPNLQPETSVSKTGGLVLDVPGKWLEGLSVSVDLWQTYYTNKIGGPSRQVLIDFFPERVFRAPKSASDPAAYAGLITGFDTSNINLASQKARGIDYELSYRRRFNFGQLSSSMAYSNPVPIVTQSTPAAVPTSTFGQMPWRLSGSFFWSKDAWTAGTTMSYQARYYVNGLTSTAYPSVILWNPQLAYNFAKNPAFGERAGTWWARALAGSRLRVTVPNVFNREPSPSDAINGRIVMDQRLRRYVLAFTKKL